MPDKIDKRSMQGLIEEYKKAIEKELGTKIENPKVVSKEYQEFRREYMPRHLNLYEELCNLSEKFLKISPGKKTEDEITESVQIAHLKVTPAGVISFSILFSSLVLLFGSLFSLLIMKSTFFLIFFLALGLSLIAILIKLPDFLANGWRLKASNQMVLCIFYVVTYMRHTSNLENAIEFAADHLAPPLSIDLKKVLW